MPEERGARLSRLGAPGIVAVPAAIALPEASAEAGANSLPYEADAVVDCCYRARHMIDSCYSSVIVVYHERKGRDVQGKKKGQKEIFFRRRKRSGARAPTKQAMPYETPKGYETLTLRKRNEPEGSTKHFVTKQAEPYEDEDGLCRGARADARGTGARRKDAQCATLRRRQQNNKQSNKIWKMTARTWY